MKGILEKIVDNKRREVQRLKQEYALTRLKKDKRLNYNPLSLEYAIRKGSGVIAEFKRASPSKGLIRKNANIEEIVKGYELSGASAVSILTDCDFFGAEIDDLACAREAVNLPILRKEFIISEYQIYQAKILGADCILLIAAILQKKVLQEFLDIALGIGLEVIVEVHAQNELDKLSGRERIIGVNNRNLDTFKIDINTSIQLASQINGVLKLSESGLNTGSNLSNLIDIGYEGFLVGESFMKEPSPGAACKEFVYMVNSCKS